VLITGKSPSSMATQAVTEGITVAASIVGEP
jgi:hypothetical protein